MPVGDCVMRAVRVRFTPSRARSGATRARAIKSLEGVQSYRNSPAGRALKAEEIQRQWQLQSGICPECNQRIPLTDARFKNLKVTKTEISVNPVIHKRCPCPQV